MKQEQKKPQPGLFEQYATAKWLVQFPALTLMVIFRRDLGYRLLNPLALLATNGILFVVGVLAQPGNAQSQPIFLAVFGAFSFVCGMAQKALRIVERAKGQIHHSKYIGTSPLHRWMPAFLRRDRRDARFLDPLIWTGIGFACLTFSHALAGWIIFSALCLRLFEFTVNENELATEMDTADSLIEADGQNQTMERMERQSESPQMNDSGIPTGLGKDISHKIKPPPH